MNYPHKEKSCIIFDLADTLISLYPKPEEIIHDYFRDNYSKNINKLKIREALIFLSNIFHYSSINIKTIKQRETFYLNYNKNLLNNLGLIHLATPENIFELFKKEKPTWNFKEGTKELLNNLKNNKYKIGLISNFNGKEALKILSKNNSNELFDFIHISENEGLEKPNTEFYSNFLSKNSLDKDSCLYIGDSYTLDYIPSKLIDLPFVLLDEINIFKHIKNRVSNLSEISQMLF